MVWSTIVVTVWVPEASVGAVLEVTDPFDCMTIMVNVPELPALSESPL